MAKKISQETCSHGCDAECAEFIESLMAQSGCPRVNAIGAWELGHRQCDIEWLAETWRNMSAAIGVANTRWPEVRRHVVGGARIV